MHVVWHALGARLGYRQNTVKYSICHLLLSTARLDCKGNKQKKEMVIYPLRKKERRIEGSGFLSIAFVLKMNEFRYSTPLIESLLDLTHIVLACVPQVY